MVHKWVFCEDLGSSSSNKDYDYNDLVFDAKIIKEQKVLRDDDGNETTYTDDPTISYYAEVTPLAAGGELTIKFNALSSTIHGMFTPSTADNVLINTCRFDQEISVSHVEGRAGNTETIRFASENDASINNIVVIVRSQTAAYDLSAYQGAAPHKLCVPVATRWAYERTDIKEAYTGFETYVGGGAEPWANTGVEDNLYPLDGVAYDMKTDKTGTVSYEEVSSSSTTTYNYTLVDAANEHNVWTGDTDFVGWDGNYALVIDKENFANVGNGTVLRFYGVASGDFAVKAVYADSWNNVDLGDSRWSGDNCVYSGSNLNGCFELKLNTTTANYLKSKGMRLWGTNLKLLCVTYDNSNKVADETPDTPSTGDESSVDIWTGSNDGEGWSTIYTGNGDKFNNAKPGDCIRITATQKPNSGWWQFNLANTAYEDINGYIKNDTNGQTLSTLGYQDVVLDQTAIDRLKKGGLMSYKSNLVFTKVQLIKK